MNPHALVIGGTRGIGRAVSKALIADGYTVSAIGRRAPSDRDQQQPNIRYWLADLADHERVDAVLAEIVEEQGLLSAVVFSQRYRGAEDDWAGEMRTTLEGTRHVIDRLAGGFSPEQGGSIVVIGSLVGHLVTTEQPLSYHVGKAGLNHLVRYYAVNLGPRRIRVNCVSPATVLKEESRNFYAENDKLYSMYTDLSPLRHMATAEEIADVVVFLCSSKSAVITGQNIFVDCGISLQSQEALARRLTSLANINISRPAGGDHNA